MENQGYTHERIIRLLKGEPDFWHDLIEGLGWGFMIPFTENDIRRYLNINIDLPGTGATTWHKLIIANVDPKQHGTTFDLNHAILIYVLMTEGVVNIPRIMRDVLLKHPMENSRNLLPYPMLISRLASRFQVPVFPEHVFYELREQGMSCSYGDLKGEQPKVCRGRVIPPPRQPQVQQEEQQQPPPAASKIPSTSVQYLSETSLQEIMRHLERQERLLRR
ncbi:hypothetical protein PIB30_062677 [Stylosanthes scabra]|uniref:Uncharacterized protein n=1 Tax=Stylosanthes scabra TaxID=79078 RepID=A0ABU6UL41_9FABA|nr:hypothetical protein [Stylosanthes scabra]